MSRRKHQTVRDDKLPFYLKDGASAGGRFIQLEAFLAGSATPQQPETCHGIRRLEAAG